MSNKVLVETGKESGSLMRMDFLAAPDHDFIPFLALDATSEARKSTYGPPPKPIKSVPRVWFPALFFPF